MTLGFPRSDTQTSVPFATTSSGSSNPFQTAIDSNFELAGLRFPEQLDLTAIAVHDEDRAVRCDRHPVHGHELAGAGALRAELGQVFALGIEHHDARVRQSVADQHPPVGQERHVLRLAK